MEIALSADPHQVKSPAKVIVVVRDNLVPIYERLFDNLEKAISFVQKLQEKGLLFTKRVTRYQILVMVADEEQYCPVKSKFTKKVWGGNIVNEFNTIQEHFTGGLS